MTLVRNEDERYLEGIGLQQPARLNQTARMGRVCHDFAPPMPACHTVFGHGIPPWSVRNGASKGKPNVIQIRSFRSR